MQHNAIEPKHQDYRGHFCYTYKDDQDSPFEFGGESISQSDAIIRMAGLPHNEIPTLKILKEFGARFTRELRQQNPSRKKAYSGGHCQV
ncbi:MAG: hypothetical protein GY820_33205 [Gammaproteobacteria bacterium]|nr:hypothetical protein [Gammaproteobacteria bacterium]